MTMPLPQLLSDDDVARLLPWPDCIRAVEAAFRAHGAGEPAPFGALGIAVPGGGFHTKAAALTLGGRAYFAAKTNGNFPGNPARGQPTIQGILLLSDASDGTPLALMPSGELTRRRTAAAAAVAARRLARPHSVRLAMIGCGAQALAQLEALVAVLPLRSVAALDRDAARAAAFAAAARGLGLDATVAERIPEADVIVTCTTSHRPVLAAADVRPGAFIAAVGADHPEKRELPGDLMARAAVIVDSLDQAAHMGDLHHALEDGVMRRADVRGELGAVVCGAVAGRRSEEEIVIFDSTGLALQDVAAAAHVYERHAAATRP
jgi:ornithine cyclodeaminase/alanine dehydrogenase-like protein (mu-crystallin family)